MATTEGIGVSSGFQRDKDAAVRCWQQVLERCGVADKVLASEAGMSKSYFSRVSAGEQGDLLGLIFRLGQQRPELRREFICRLHEREIADPKVTAAGDLVVAALRFLRVSGAAQATAGGV